MTRSVAADNIQNWEDGYAQSTGEAGLNAQSEWYSHENHEPTSLSALSPHSRNLEARGALKFRSRLLWWNPFPFLVVSPTFNGPPTIAAASGAGEGAVCRPAMKISILSAKRSQLLKYNFTILGEI